VQHNQPKEEMTTTTADIQRYEVSAEGNIYYFIKVVYNGREWAVRKRYSDFSKLDEYLLKDGFKLSYALPSKQFWNRFDKKALMERQKGLQSYLNTLLTNTVSSDNSLVKEFLEVDHNRLQHARKQSFHALKRTERLESLVSIMSRMVIHIPVKNTVVYQSQTAPVTRERQGSNSLTNPQSLNGPYMQKSKSLSFSRFSFSSNSRKNSFQPDSRQSFAMMERKHSLDFVPSSNKSSSVDVATLKDLLKTEAYEYGVNALFPCYEAEMATIFNDANNDTDGGDLYKQTQYQQSQPLAQSGSNNGLPRSYYRSVTNAFNSAASPSSVRRHSLAELVPQLCKPTPTIANDRSIEEFLDAKLIKARKQSPVPFSVIPENDNGDRLGNLRDLTPTDFSDIHEEDERIAREAQEFVNLQRKYRVLVYLTSEI
jgi:hypothetical protein